MIFLRPLSQDEGVFLAVAKGITKGYLPYRDFFDHKPPGIYFALSPAAITGSTFWPKILLLAVIAFLSFFTYRLSEKILSGTGFFAVVFLTFGLIFFEGNLIVAEIFVALFTVIAAYCLILNKRSIPVFWAGFFAGLALLFKQSAIFSLLALATAVFFVNKKQLLFFIMGTLVTLGVFILYLEINNLWSEGIRQIITVNLFFYPKEPIVEVLKKLGSVFLATIPLWALAIYGIIKKRVPLLIFLLIALPLPILFYRHYPHYFIQILPFVAIAAGISLAEREAWKKVILAFLCLTTAIFLVRHQMVNLPKIIEERKIREELLSEEGSLIAENQFTAFYYLSNLEPLNKYLYITEVNDWSEAAEYKTITDLKNNSETIVIWPSDSNFAYAKKLQEYILNNYSVALEYKKLNLVVLKKR